MNYHKLFLKYALITDNKYLHYSKHNFLRFSKLNVLNT